MAFVAVDHALDPRALGLCGKPLGLVAAVPGPVCIGKRPVGRSVAVQYNPSSSCGAKSITIKNKATATLYYFTPYQPNASALAAGWGTGNGCSG